MCRGEKLFLLILLSFVSISILGGWVGQGQTQEKYPTRLIEAIAPVSPGGGIDTFGRVSAPYLAKHWGVPVNITNKPGGNFVSGTLDVYKATPDGYTVLVDSNASSTMMEKIAGGPKNLPLNIMERTFIAIGAAQHELFYVKKDSPINSLKDLEALVKKDPEKITWAAIGGAADYAIYQFMYAIGVDITKTKPVQATGAGRGVPMIAGGHVIFSAATVPSSLPSIKSGLIKPLALAAAAREPELPDLPTTAEAGYPMITAVQWLGYSGPPKLPSYIVEIWNKAIEEMVKDKETLSRWEKVGTKPFYHNASEAREYVIKERADLDKVWKVAK